MEAPVNKPSILLHCKAQICCKSGVKGWTDIHTYIQYNFDTILIQFDTIDTIVLYFVHIYIYISRRIISSKIFDVKKQNKSATSDYE